MRQSITLKIIVTILCLIVVPLTAAGTWFYFDLQDKLGSVEVERSSDDLVTAQQLFDYLAGELTSNLKQNAYWGDFHDAMAQGDRAFLQDSVLSVLDVNENLDAIYISDLQGNLLEKRETDRLQAEALLPKLVKQVGEEMTGSGLLRTEQGVQLVAVSKVTDEEGAAEPNGLLYFFRPVNEKFLGLLKEINKTEIVLYDGKQLLATHEGMAEEAVQSVFAQVRGQDEALSLSRLEDAGTVTQSFARLSDVFGEPIGFLGTETLSATGADIRRDLLEVGLFAALLLLLVGGGLGWLLYRWVSKPLRRLQQEMARVASGDLSDLAFAESLQNRTRTDEIGEISQAFLTMKDGLKGLVQRVYEESNLLTDGSREFAAATQEGRGTLGLISASSAEIGGLVERTFDQVAEASSKLITLERQAQNISGHAGAAVEAAQGMKQAAAVGQEQVARSISAMGGLRASAEESETRVLALQQTADEINTIIDRIKAISKQTRLLALNASIEASRAGEQGRGFAVVAEEVGKLADEAHGATGEIEGLIMRVKASIVDVSETSVELRGKSAVGVAAVQGTQEAFSEILERVEAVEGKIREIRAEASKQEVITQEGVTAVAAVKRMADEMVGSVSEAATATETALSSMHAIAENSHQLAELAEDLLADVGKFRL